MERAALASGIKDKVKVWICWGEDFIDLDVLKVIFYGLYPW